MATYSRMTNPLIFLLTILIGLPAAAQTNTSNNISSPSHLTRYAAIGDSYSIGEGASPAEAWPAQLARHLTASGLNVTLVANPSRTGWTTQQAIDDELPVWRAARPDFASVQIGVNDWVQGVDAQTFQQRLVTLLDAMQQVIPDTNRLFLVTIPDFSVTPTGAMFSGGRNIALGVAGFNGIIKREAARRGLPVVDIFTLSKKMGDDPSLIAPDGLHPSAKEYRLWEEMIFPTAQKLLTKSSH
ncbi:MAG TPA: SGNH/GDSL hydrolase family protein [Verrucomicrobiae bacterium]|jgi:lysophospholipase L1-like esterase